MLSADRLQEALSLNMCLFSTFECLLLVSLLNQLYLYLLSCGALRFFVFNCEDADALVIQSEDQLIYCSDRLLWGGLCALLYFDH